MMEAVSPNILSNFFLNNQKLRLEKNILGDIFQFSSPEVTIDKVNGNVRRLENGEESENSFITDLVFRVWKIPEISWD